ncbi:YlbG family protein [Mycoplasmatota bacterium]|nr:YlbG family protein [Mycoplasmatota bacterium]
MVKRKGIVIYFRSHKLLKKLNHFDINITYVNKLGKYLTGYVNESKYDEIEKALRKIKLVKKVESSRIDMEEFSFSG